MSTEDPDREPTHDDLVREAEAVRAARRARDAELTPAERLEKLHHLCAQAAALAAAERHDRP